MRECAISLLRISFAPYQEVVVLEGRVGLFPLLLAGLPVHRGALEVVLLVDPEVVGEDVAHHHHVVLDVVHSEAVHAEVLGQQGLACN